MIFMAYHWYSSGANKGTYMRLFGYLHSDINPSQNSRQLPDDIFELIFLIFCRKGPINNIRALIQIMAWRRPDGMPLSEAMMASLLTHISVQLITGRGIGPETCGVGDVFSPDDLWYLHEFCVDI